MKVKRDFVTNSSSTAFVFDVKEKLTADVLAARLFGDQGFIDEYKSYNWDAQESLSITNIIKSLNDHYDFPLEVGEHLMVFGDEEGTVAGQVFDYCLRIGYSFKEVEIGFSHYLR